MTKITQHTRWQRIQAALTLARASGLAATLVFAVLVAVFVSDPVPTSIDIAVTQALQSQQWLDVPMRIVSIPGNGLNPVVLTALTVVLLVALGQKREGAVLAASAGVGALLNSAIKHAVGRPRPSIEHVLKLDLVTGFSFPSGHVAFYVCYFGFLAFLAKRRIDRTVASRTLVTLAILPIVLVPFSRIYLGAHWASDTVGALLWSCTWLALITSYYDAARLSAKLEASRDEVT
jgi:membrane-associated phospholipid phosphatase